MRCTVPATIRASTIDEIRSHAGELLKQHWSEVALNKSVMVLRPDWQRYEDLEAAGMLLCLGAFVEDEPIGYSISFIHTHLHYSELLYAQNDVLFVTQEHRASRIGMRLIAETERLAAGRGARLMLWHAKQGTALDSIMPRLGYAVQDIIYSKEIG